MKKTFHYITKLADFPMGTLIYFPVRILPPSSYKFGRRRTFLHCPENSLSIYATQLKYDSRPRLECAEPKITLWNFGAILRISKLEVMTYSAINISRERKYDYLYISVAFWTLKIFIRWIVKYCLQKRFCLKQSFF